MGNKVMIVVEGTLYGHLLAREFQAHGFGVCAVHDSGEDALRTAIHERPDAILMEFLLQGDLNGIETAKKLRDDLSASVVFLNNQLEQNWLHKAKQLGVATILNKNESPARVVAAFQDAVEQVSQ